jgi:hypothetical protein
VNRISSRIRFAALAAVFVVVASACGDDEPVAEVDGGDSITQSEVVEIAAVISGVELAGENLKTLGKAEAAQAITSWARTEIFYAELAVRGYEVDESFFAASEAEIEGFRSPDPTVEDNVPDADTFEYELAVRGNALIPIVIDYLVTSGVEPVWPVLLCSSHILVDTEDEALAIIDRIDQGEDFGALAAELSTGPSGPNGGALGCVDPATFVPEFTAGAAATEEGGVSAPTESQFGWHVILVDSFGNSPSEDSDAIEAALLETQEFLDYQEAAITRDVDVDPQYGVWDSDPNVLAVVAN